jgi:hypothetical protein
VLFHGEIHLGDLIIGECAGFAADSVNGFGKDEGFSARYALLNACSFSTAVIECRMQSGLVTRRFHQDGPPIRIAPGCCRGGAVARLGAHLEE